MGAGYLECRLIEEGGCMPEQKNSVLQLIENAEREAAPIARSSFATQNESTLAQTVLDLSNAVRLMIGAPERTEYPY